MLLMLHITWKITHCGFRSIPKWLQWMMWKWLHWKMFFWLFRANHEWSWWRRLGPIQVSLVDEFCCNPILDFKRFDPHGFSIHRLGTAVGSTFGAPYYDTRSWSSICAGCWTTVTMASVRPGAHVDQVLEISILCAKSMDRNWPGSSASLEGAPRISFNCINSRALVASVVGFLLACPIRCIKVNELDLVGFGKLFPFPRTEDGEVLVFLHISGVSASRWIPWLYWRTDSEASRHLWTPVPWCTKTKTKHQHGIAQHQLGITRKQLRDTIWKLLRSEQARTTITCAVSASDTVDRPTKALTLAQRDIRKPNTFLSWRLAGIAVVVPTRKPQLLKMSNADPSSFCQGLETSGWQCFSQFSISAACACSMEAWRESSRPWSFPVSARSLPSHLPEDLGTAVATSQSELCSSPTGIRQPHHGLWRSCSAPPSAIFLHWWTVINLKGFQPLKDHLTISSGHNCASIHHRDLTTWACLTVRSHHLLATLHKSLMTGPKKRYESSLQPATG